MNFKLTLLKTIISVIVFIMVDYILANGVTCLDAPCSTSKLMLTPILILVGLIGGIIIYIIWSLIQKKK